VWGNINATHHRRTCSVCARINDEEHAWSIWWHMNATQHHRLCSIASCAGEEIGNHVLGRVNDSWVHINAVPVAYAHNFRCNDCNFLMSGHYNCVFNANNICVGSVFHSNATNQSGQIVGNTMPNVGCGAHRDFYRIVS
jgi:hypothetical protein